MARKSTSGGPGWNRFQQLLREEQGKVAPGAPFSAWSAAAKRASARYHGARATRRNPRHLRVNPRRGGLMQWVLFGLAGYAGYKLLIKKESFLGIAPPR